MTETNHAELYFAPHNGKPPLFGKGGRLEEHTPRRTEWRDSESALCFEAALLWLMSCGKVLLRTDGRSRPTDKEITVDYETDNGLRSNWFRGERDDCFFDSPTHHHAIVAACHAVLDAEETQ